MQALVVVVAPLFAVACDVDEGLDLGAPDEVADEEEVAEVEVVGEGPEDVGVAPDDPQEGLLCDLLCLLQAPSPACGGDGELYAKPCLARCESGDSTAAGTYWPDEDGDGYGDAEGDEIAACAAEEGIVDNNDDCDDSSDAVAPDQAETCDGLDNDCDAGTACVPTSCADLQLDGVASDGDRTLYVDGDPAKPWTAYCHDMAGAAGTYLTLLANGPGQNQSQFTRHYQPYVLTTTFSRVRIETATLNVDIDDLTFSQSVGMSYHGQTPLTAMPYGVTQSCDGSSGAANMNLTGTPFKITDEFYNWGYQEFGTLNRSQDDQVVDLTGGGACGWYSPSGAHEPHLFNNGAVLQLAYIDP